MKGLEQETQPFVDFSADPLEIHLGPQACRFSSFLILKIQFLQKPVPILDVRDGCQHRILKRGVLSHPCLLLASFYNYPSIPEKVPNGWPQPMMSFVHQAPVAQHGKPPCSCDLPPGSPGSPRVADWTSQGPNCLHWAFQENSSLFHPTPPLPDEKLQNLQTQLWSS